MERVELYLVIPLLGKNIPTYVSPAHVYDSVPTDEEVEWEVRRLRGHRLGGPYRMRAKDLREWLQEH